MEGEKVCDGSIECHLNCNCRRCFHCSAWVSWVTIKGTSWFLLLTLFCGIIIIGPAITISYSVFVVIGATSVVFANTFIIITYITAALIFQKNPTLFLVLISRCHLKVYTVQISKLPPISVSKFLLFLLFLPHKSSFSQVFPPAKPPWQV